MSGVIFRHGNEIKYFTASEYTAVTPGAKTLYIQTGSEINNRIPYGLTTDTTASEYSPVIMFGGKKHYIARMTTIISKTTSQREETYTRESNYVSYDVVNSYMTKQTSYFVVANYAAKTTSTYYPKITEYTFAITSYTMGKINNPIYRTVTLTNTSFNASQGNIYFSTKQSVNAGTAVNGLVYLFKGSQTLSTNPLITNRYESYWEILPINNTNYKYDGNRGAEIVSTCVSNVSYIQVTETARERRDAYNVFISESVKYPNITKEFSTDANFVNIIRSSLYGGNCHHTSKKSETLSLIDNTYTRYTSIYSIGDIYISSYSYNNYGNKTLINSARTMKITNDSILGTHSIFTDTFTKMTQKTYGTSTYRTYRLSFTSTTNSANYWRVIGTFSKNSYLANTTSYSLSRSYYGGLFKSYNASKSARNHLVYSYNTTGKGYVTFTKGTPYIPYKSINIHEIIDSVSTLSILRTSSVVYLVSHHALVSTASRNTTRKSTVTNYYTDTINTTVETNNVNV